jgi:hypothetical protein
MRSVLIILTFGICSSLALWSTSAQEPQRDSKQVKTIQYAGIDQQKLDQIKSDLNSYLSRLGNNEGSQDVEELMRIVKGLDNIKKTKSLTSEFHLPVHHSPLLPHGIIWATFALVIVFELKRRSDYKNILAKISRPLASVNDQDEKNILPVAKDFNQIVSEASLEMNSSLESIGKYFDLELNQSALACKLNANDISTICRDFILACHNLASVHPQATGLHIRTDGTAHRLAIDCFIPDLQESDLVASSDCKKFIKKLWQIENYSRDLNPQADLKSVRLGEVMGLKISLSFDNAHRAVSATQLVLS